MPFSVNGFGFNRAPVVPMLPAAAVRTLDTPFQINAARPAFVFYSVQTTITASISGGQDCELVLEIAPDATFSTGAQTISVAAASQLYTLAVALQGVQKNALQVSGYVPAGYFARLRTVKTTGAPVFLYRAGQEVLA